MVARWQALGPWLDQHAANLRRGLSEGRVAVRTPVDKAIDGIRVLAGIECDILPDGRLDLADDCLAALDIVVASVHSAIRQDESEITARLIRAIENPWVDVIGHPTNRILLRREPAQLNLERVFAAAASHGVALEINCQLDRLDLCDSHARLARDRGVKLVI